jgi:hypothetical protein
MCGTILVGQVAGSDESCFGEEGECWQCDFWVIDEWGKGKMKNAPLKSAKEFGDDPTCFPMAEELECVEEVGHTEYGTLDEVKL